MYPGENVTWRKRTLRYRERIHARIQTFSQDGRGGGVGEWGRSLGDGSGGQDSRTDKLGCVFRKKKRTLKS